MTKQVVFHDKRAQDESKIQSRDLFAQHPWSLVENAKHTHDTFRTRHKWSIGEAQILSVKRNKFYRLKKKLSIKKTFFVG